MSARGDLLPLPAVRFSSLHLQPSVSRVPGLRGAFIIASTPYSCVGFGDQHRGIVVLLSV